MNGCPFVTTAGQNIKMLDIVPLENGVKSENDGLFELSWYDTTKKGFRKVVWFKEIYNSEGDTLTDQGGWAEDADEQFYPEDIETLSFGPGQWFFIFPYGSTVNPSFTVAGQLYTTDATKTTTFLPLTTELKTCVGNPLPVETYLKDVVPFEGDSKSANDGLFELSWYDTTKKGFRKVVWFKEIYNSEGDTLTDQGGWAEDADEQFYPEDIETIKWSVGAGFFVFPYGSTVNPSIHFINPFYKD